MQATSKEETFKKVGSLAEELVNGNNMEEIIKNFTQLKVSDRLMPECLHMIIRKSYDKAGKFYFNFGFILPTSIVSRLIIIRQNFINVLY